MFRTPTGQTGRDAYLYEAAQIANSRRARDAEWLIDLLLATHERPACRGERS